MAIRVVVNNASLCREVENALEIFRLANPANLTALEAQIDVITDRADVRAHEGKLIMRLPSELASEHPGVIAFEVIDALVRVLDSEQSGSGPARLTASFTGEVGRGRGQS